MFAQRPFFSEKECFDMLDFYELKYEDTFRLDWGHESRYQRLLQIEEPSIRSKIKSILQYNHNSVCAELGIQHFDLELNEIFISKYEVDEGVGWHKDRPYLEYRPPFENKRMYNFSVCINRDYAGGTLVVDEDEVSTSLETCTMFDVNHKHMVQPVELGTRYSLIGWAYKKALL